MHLVLVMFATESQPLNVCFLLFTYTSKGYGCAFAFAFAFTLGDQESEAKIRKFYLIAFTLTRILKE